MMILNKNTFIYSLSDENNIVRYIGKTSNLKRRIKEHIIESKKDNKSYKNRWINSQIKNGFYPKIEIIDEVPSNEWMYWECFYISLFKSWNFNLTNRTPGGNGTGSGIDNPNYGKKLTEEHKKKCSIKLKGENNPFYGKTHSTEILKKIYKPVIQYSINGEFIKEWNSIKDAENTLKIHSISSCCHNKLLSVGGCVWKFKENDNYPLKIEIMKHYRKPVLQFTKDGKFIKHWDSVSHAENSLKIKHVSKVCNGYKSHKSSGGFLWKYGES
jgi:group I intron endonuclease